MLFIKGIKTNDEEFISKEIEKNQQVLYLQYNQLVSVNLSPLIACTKLRRLALHKNQLASVDLSPLKKCTELQELWIQKNQLKELDVTILKKCTKLNTLNVDADVTLIWREQALPKKEDLPKGLQEHFTRIKLVREINILSDSGEYFPKFLREMKDEIEHYVKLAIDDWENAKKQGMLSTLIKNTINSFRKNTKSLLDFREYSSTLVANLNEIFISYLIKIFFETIDQKYSVFVEERFPDSKRPDIRIDKNGKNIAIIELKFYLKNQNYKGEKDRKKFYEDHVKIYGLLQFWSGELSLVQKIIEDQSDWIYLINFENQIKQIKKANKKGLQFWTDENTKKAIERLTVSNPVEILLDKILQYTE